MSRSRVHQIVAVHSSRAELNAHCGMTVKDTGILHD